jgi:CheY-like chemotaxis protein
MDTTTAQRTVLVVEDDDDARLSFTEVLEEDGYRVAQARDGREAEAYLRDNPPPAAVVLDLMMPRLDGWSVAAMIKQGHLPSVPIVVITAAGDRWGYPVPPELVLKKPITPSALLDAVHTIAGRADSPAA